MRSFKRYTNFSPDQVSSTAHTFTSTSPSPRPISRIKFSLRSVAFPEVFLGQEIQSEPLAARQPFASLKRRFKSAWVVANNWMKSSFSPSCSAQFTLSGNGPRILRYPGGPLSSAMRCPGLMPSFLTSGVPEYPAITGYCTRPPLCQRPVLSPTPKPVTLPTYESPRPAAFFRIGRHGCGLEQSVSGQTPRPQATPDVYEVLRVRTRHGEAQRRRAKPGRADRHRAGAETGHRGQRHQGRRRFLPAHSVAIRRVFLLYDRRPDHCRPGQESAYDAGRQAGISRTHSPRQGLHRHPFRHRHV